MADLKSVVSLFHHLKVFGNTKKLMMKEREREYSRYNIFVHAFYKTFCISPDKMTD